MKVDCLGNDSEGVTIKIILTKTEIAKLANTVISVISVEVPASRTEYGINTRIIIERNE